MAEYSGEIRNKCVSVCTYKFSSFILLNLIRIVCMSGFKNLIKNFKSCPQDGVWNMGAVSTILHTVQQGIDHSNLTQEEEHHVRHSNEIAFNKLILPTYEVRMAMQNFDIQEAVGFGSFGQIWKVSIP